LSSAETAHNTESLRANITVFSGDGFFFVWKRHHHLHRAKEPPDEKFNPLLNRQHGSRRSLDHSSSHALQTADSTYKQSRSGGWWSDG